MGYSNQELISQTVNQCLEAKIDPVYAAKTIHDGLGGFESLYYNHRANSFKIRSSDVVYNLFPECRLCNKTYEVIEDLAVELARYIFYANQKAVTIHTKSHFSTKHRMKQFRQEYNI